ncbi:hypothetical protein D9M72_592240 [compost metagenome]
MRRNAVLAGAEDRVTGVQSVDGGAAGAGRALVAAGVQHAEIGTAHPLQHVAAHRRHVAQLRRGALNQAFGDQWLQPLDVAIGRDFGHASQRADDEVVAFDADTAKR